MKFWDDEAVLYRIGVLLFLIFALAVVTYCQEVSHIKLHTGQDQMTYEDEMRVRTAIITGVDDELVYLKTEDKFGINLFSVGYDKDTRFYNDKAERLTTKAVNREKLYFIVYCLRHKYAVTVIQLSKE